MEHPLIPLTVFPSKIARIIEDTHESMRFPRNYIASSLIMALSVAIGNSHELTIPNGKKSKALLYMALVGSPGAMKSAPIEFAFDPIYNRDMELIKTYNKEIERYHNTSKEDRGKRPHSMQITAKDITTEALCELNSHNNHGVSLINDELTSWFGNIDKYHSKGGADTPFWLSNWNGGGVINNRKTNDKITAVKDTCTSLFGSIQPSLLHKAFSETNMTNGLFHRFLFTYDPDEEKPIHWSEEDLPSTSAEDWNSFLMNVLHFALDIENTKGRENIELSKEAWEQLKAWQNAKEDFLYQNEEEHSIAIFRKNQLYALRFCIIIHVMREIAGDLPMSTLIDEHTARQAILLAEYFFKTSALAYQQIKYKGKDELGKILSILDMLPPIFTREECIKVGEQLDMPKRTLFRYITGDNDDPFCTKIKHGVFQKRI